ncbi:MAG: hypothetical protein KDA51_00350 [Planctomycetales bacterium]|nr:hypothetical protein [Planctomycetales bacterium]
MHNKVAAWLSLVLAGIALAISAYGAFRASSDEGAMEDRVYRRIIRELWTEVLPVLEDFAVPIPQEPQTLSELMRPFLYIMEPIETQPVDTESP